MPRCLNTTIAAIALLLMSGALYAAAPAGAWWYTNFDFRFKINVPAGTAALATNYAVSFTFDHATAVASGNSLASGDDVRVVRWTGAAWVELDRVLDPDSSWNSASTKIWFKTQAAIATGVTDDNYYLYYGDTLTPGTPLQDGDNIFSLYDDFETTFDTTRWTRSNAANVTVAGGVLTVSGGRQIRSVATFPINTIWEVRSLVSTAAPSAANYYLAGDSDCTNFTFDNYIRLRADNAATDAAQVSPGTTVPATGAFTPTSPTSFQLYSFTREAAGAGRVLQNGVAVATFTGASTAAMCMFMRNEASAAQTQQYEWARVRPYRNPEPVPLLATIEALPMPAPIADWRLDQTTWTAAAGQVIDSGTNGLNMNAVNAPTTANTTPAIAGDPGTCRYGNFNGTNQYLEVADNALLDLTNQLTVTVWVYPRALGADLTSILSKDTNYEFHLNSAGKVYWWWGGAPNDLTSTATVPLNRWTHIAITYQSGVQRIYINGVLSGTNNQTAALTTNNLPLQIAQDQGLADRFFNGLIDEVKIYGAALSSAQVNTVMTTTHPCSTPTHFKISHDGYGITCLAAETITVDVLDVLNNGAPSYNQLMVLDTQTGRGTWTLISGAGTFTDATANDGLATYQWPGTQSQAKFALDYRSAIPPGTSPPGVLAFDIDAYQSTNTAFRDDDTEGLMTFSPNGFVITSSPLSNPPPATIPAFASPKIAGTDFAAYITAYGQTPTDTQCGVIEGYTGSHTLKFWPSYSNPNTGTIGLYVNNGVTSGTSGNSEATAIAESVAFTAGQSAAITVHYKDAGQIAISAKDDTTGNPGLLTGIRGSSSNFVVKPATFSLVATRTDNGAANTAPITATGAVFIPAGQAFTLAVTAQDSTGSTTPNFGRESTPETVRVTEALLLPAGGINPSMAGTFTSIASGVSTGTNFTWGEVGIITLTPRLNDGDYLGGGDVVGSAVNVGRFVPFNFGVTQNAPRIGDACGSNYVYIGQPLMYSIAPVLSLTARAMGGSTTQNYQGAFFKLTNTSSNSRVYATNTGTLIQTGLPANDPTALSLSNGLATLTFNTNAGISYARPTLPIVPFTPTLTLSLNVADSDGVAYSNSTSIAATNPYIINSPSIAIGENRYGRIAFRNAVGSELLNLPLPMHAEYFLNTTSGFVQNTDDSCTAGVTLAFTNYGGNLTSGETCLIDNGSPGVSGLGCSTAGTIGQRFSMPPSSGDFISILKAPGAGNSGTVTLTTTVPTWLQFDWNASNPGLESPSGIATFGLFQGDSKRIFQIEK